jgi:hypothetical protein
MSNFLLLAAALAAPAETPFFNGKDLDGWANVNCAPGTFSVKDGTIVTTGRPTGYLRTAKHYENFVLEFEWMHTRTDGKMANSGLFVWGDALPALGVGYTRGIEVQVLCNFEADWATSHGDLFSIWGAKCKPDRPHPKGIERCLPSERRCKGCGEWNHYKITATDGTIKLDVNGKEVSGVSGCTPRKGYLALESEGSECVFRNFKMVEKPGTNPKPADVATLDEGHVSLFDGMTLEGWSCEKDAWKTGDGTLKAAKPSELALATKRKFGELLLDYKLPAKAEGSASVVVDGKPQELNGKPGAWTRLSMKGSSLVVKPVIGMEMRSVFAK